MDKSLDRVVAEQEIPLKDQEQTEATQITKDNEITTRWAVNDFGSSQLILDFYVPTWIFNLDCAVTSMVQIPAKWENVGGFLGGFFWLLYYIAIIVNYTCSIEATALLILFAKLLELGDVIVSFFD